MGKASKIPSPPPFHLGTQVTLENSIDRIEAFLYRRKIIVMKICIF
jgi:hypothetical protein